MDNSRTVILQNNLDELEKLSIVLEEFFAEHAIDSQTLFQVNLALDELVTNIISYGYTDDLVHEILLELNFSQNILTLTIADDGKEFDPLRIPEPDVTLSVEERQIGGLGIMFVRKTMDTVEYQRRDGRNILSLKKAVGS